MLWDTLSSVIAKEQTCSFNNESLNDCVCLIFHFWRIFLAFVISPSAHPPGMHFLSIFSSSVNGHAMCNIRGWERPRSEGLKLGINAGSVWWFQHSSGDWLGKTRSIPWEYICLSVFLYLSRRDSQNTPP